jgi:hypothetical protein
VGSHAAAGNSKKTGGSGMASPLLPFLAGDHLQNTQKHNKIFVLIFFHYFQICFPPFSSFRSVSFFFFYSWLAALSFFKWQI